MKRVVAILSWALLAGALPAVTPGGPAFVFREPHARSLSLLDVAGASDGWLAAYPTGGDTNQVHFVSSVVSVKPIAGVAPAEILPDMEATPGVVAGWWRVDAGTPLEALRLAARLAEDARVAAAAPVMRRPARLHGPYAPAPNDPLFPEAFHLENRNADGSRAGADINVRAAWPHARGSGVTVGVVDDGLEITHADLLRPATGAPHTNFVGKDANVLPQFTADIHGTAVAGLIAADTDNGRGVAGTAPDARLAGMRIFSNGSLPLSDAEMASVFLYRNDAVHIQNHSWGYTGSSQLSPAPEELEAIALASTAGRGGRGVVMVRSAGNERNVGGNANNDGYLTTRWAIPVAAVRSDGRAADYSSPGANVLVAAPSSETGFPEIVTTDRTGLPGYTAFGEGDAADYARGSTGFTGTSASAPQVAGVVALMLSANPDLAVRDTQLILALSARQTDPADPHIRTNGAGLRFSENTGYGVVDAGAAVDLARRWSNRPPAILHSIGVVTNLAFPDDALAVEVPGLPGVTNFPATAALGPHPDEPTALRPLVDVGLALAPLTTNLTGKAALIERGENFFRDKIQFAADAGAAFAVVFNNVGTTERLIMGATDFSPIPAVMIGRDAGLALRAALAEEVRPARLALRGAAVVTLPVTAELLCEHVRLRVRTSHSRRGDVRITLRSPAGTVTVLQPAGDDNAPGPTDWTYLSAHLFLEGTRGDWTVTLSDQWPGLTGELLELELTLHGTPITDADGDGMDDDWVARWLGDLPPGPQNDPDHDGLNNALEQVLGTDPRAREPFRLDLSRWNSSLWRLSWNGNGADKNTAEASATLPGGFTPLTNVPSRFPVTEWFLPADAATNRFFRIVE